MLGLDRKIVELVPHQEEWKTLFEREEALIREACGDFALAIEHIGSTAIPNLAAKPIIDIMVGVRDLSEAEKFLRQPLEKIGYEYRGETGIAGRLYFRKGTATASTHHLSLVEKGGEIWRRHILFRDYLRANAEAARSYNELKKNLAIKFKDRREDYTNGKTEFVEEILLKAGFSEQN
jgi:GrpB-like predicted nucleotidyltransferase (UPF0157 family)